MLLSSLSPWKKRYFQGSSFAHPICSHAFTPLLLLDYLIHIAIFFAIKNIQFLPQKKKQPPFQVTVLWWRYAGSNRRPLECHGAGAKNTVAQEKIECSISNGLSRAALSLSTALFRCFSCSFWYGFWYGFARRKCYQKKKCQKSTQSNYITQLLSSQIIEVLENIPVWLKITCFLTSSYLPILS